LFQHAHRSLTTNANDQLFLLKESFNGPIAKRLQSAGYNALVYDHRGWGSSDPSYFSNGSSTSFPRQEYNPAQQAADIHDAVRFAKDLEGVDGNRVALWGTGHGAGASFIAASDDANVKAVIGAFPWFSGSQNVQFLPEGLVERATSEFEARSKDQMHEPRYSKIWDETLEEAKGERRDIFAHGEGSYQLLDEARALAKAAGTPWENKTTLRSFYYLINTEPRDHLRKIKVPILVVCGPRGIFTYDYEGQEKVLAERSPHAELVLVQGEDVRESEASFGPMMDAHVAFLKKHF
jgi:hypothetical protein